MRRTNHGDEPEYGLMAAFKAVAVVLAVGILALVAGQSAYKSDAGSVASPKYQLIEPAPDDAPYIGAATQAGERIENGGPRLLATAPAGISAPEMQSQESSRPRTASAPDEEPVATF